MWEINPHDHDGHFDSRANETPVPWNDAWTEIRRSNTRGLANRAIRNRGLFYSVSTEWNR